MFFFYFFILLIRNRNQQSDSFIEKYNLRRFYSHHNARGIVRITIFELKLNKIKEIEIHNGQTSESVKSPIYLSIRLKKITDPQINSKLLRSLKSFNKQRRKKASLELSSTS